MTGVKGDIRRNLFDSNISWDTLLLYIGAEKHKKLTNPCSFGLELAHNGKTINIQNYETTPLDCQAMKWSNEKTKATFVIYTTVKFILINDFSSNPPPPKT